MRLIVRLPVFALAALLLGTLFVACEGQKETREPEPLETYLPLSVAGNEIQAQLAIKTNEQARGLMYRDSLAPNHGMLFPYPQPRGMSFWMKNTFIPLDIGFFDGKGVLREVHQMYPRDLRQVRSSSQEIQYALEMNQGWFASAGVRPGARLDLKLLAEALRARGADPALYGLPKK
jgi:hypothetical protein